MRLRKIFFLFAFLMSFALTGCIPVVTPSYTPADANIQLIRDADIDKVFVGQFDIVVDNSSLKAIKIRAAKLVSPYGENFADYLKNALRSELTRADKFDPNSKIVISGTLLDQDLESGVAINGTGFIKARFVVTKDGKEVFNKDLVAKVQWGSNFLGGIALGRAMEQYSVLVANLIHELFSDSEFLKAVGAKGK